MPGSHSGRPDATSFARAIAIAIVSLVVVCGIFVTLGYFQGPKLSGASIDLAAATTRGDPQLRMFANQIVDPIDQADVTVTPATDFNVDTVDDIITVSFDQMLRSDTAYSVEIRGVTSPYEDVASTLSYEFETDVATFHYLDRADPTVVDEGQEPGQDEVIRVSVGDSRRETVVRATGIQDYLVFDEFVAVATLENNLESAVILVDPESGMTERLSLPTVGTIDLLEGSTSANVLGFTVTSEQEGEDQPEYVQALFAVDLAGAHSVQPVEGLDGEQLDILNWQVIPGTSRAIVQSIDQSLLVIDLAGEDPPVPLGDYDELGRMSEDGSQVTVSNIFGQFAVSLDDGTETRLPLAAVNGIVPFGGDIQLLGDDVARVQQVAIFDDATGRFSSHIVFQDAESARVLYEKTDQVGSIETFEVSPNGQYLTVTTIPDVAASTLDGYLVNPVSTSISTIVIDLESGTALGSVDGFDIRW